MIARHIATGRNVAIKYLNEELCSETAFRTALRTEARLLGDLTSPHVTRLYEYVEAERGAAIVMELVYGAALRALLTKAGRTDTEAALAVLKGSLLGLSAAHGVGVVHRDYKPENVLVNWDGRTKLVDFGISTRTGTRHNLHGTWPYMPPEQWRTEAATPAGDVYAATVTLYECLTGGRPFGGPGRWDYQRQHVYEPVPTDPVPEEVRGLVRHGMAKDPALRPQSALDFLRELEWAAEDAYGPDWEERGQSRLATAAAALVPAVVSRLDVSLVGSSADLARTVLTARKRRRPRRRGDVLTGAAAVTVAGLLSLLPGGWAGGAEAPAGAHTRAVTTLDAQQAGGTAPQTRDSGDGGTASDSDGTGTSGTPDGDGRASGAASSDSGSGGASEDSGTDSGTARGTGRSDTGTDARTDTRTDRHEDRPTDESSDGNEVVESRTGTVVPAESDRGGPRTGPSESTPTESTRPQNPPAESATPQNPPAESTPAQTNPTDSAPSQRTPSQNTPSQSTPSQSTPSQSTPSQSTPSQSTPSQSTPSQSTPLQSTPSQSTTTSQSTTGQSTTSQNTYGSGTPVSGTGSAVTPRQGVPVTVDGEPG